MFATFKDNTPENGTETSQEVLIRTLGSDVFTEGSSGLPRHTLELAQSELLTATNIPTANVQCQDQFIIRLKLFLTDGRSFSVEDGSSSVVIAFDTIFSSPFCYTVNIVEPIDNNQFIGMYQYTSIVNGPFGATFGSPKTLEIKRGNSVYKTIIRIGGYPFLGRRLINNSRSIREGSELYALAMVWILKSAANHFLYSSRLPPKGG